MENLTLTDHGHDFSALHAAMRRYVDGDILSGVSSAVLVGRDLVDLHCAGMADRERQIPLRVDHLFRVFSNTKLVTSIAALLLFDEGRFELDEPVERFIPQLGNRRVLKPGAASLADTEAARSPITIRHLLTHTSGLSYGLFDPGSMLFKAYVDARVRHPTTSLAGMMDALADLPLVYHPGTSWEYSVATDVVSRLVEVVSGQSFDAFIKARILEPLGMVDTGFVIPPSEQHRLAAYYVGADAENPLLPGLTRKDDFPFPNANLQPVAWLSGGGGLVSNLPDMIALIRSLLPGGKTLLKPATVTAMMTNQLPDGMTIRFPMFGEIKGKGFGLAGSVTLAPSRSDPPGSTGEFQWGGIAGTHWWVSPRHDLSGLVMTQRQMAFWHPFSFELKRAVCDAVVRGGAGTSR